MYQVLIVEDDPQVARITEEFLRQSGYGIAGIAGNTEEALSCLRQNKVQLVLLDIYLPGASGLEVLRKLRTEQAKIEAIIISAAKDGERIREAFSMGCVDYIIKPFTYTRLTEALYKFKERCELLGQLSLEQSEVDRLSGQNRGETDMVELSLPKGIDRNTLQRIAEELIGRTEAFCVQELAERMEFSRVSVKKYLDFLTKEKILKKTYIYGSVGRPLNEYRVIREPAELRRLTQLKALDPA